MIEIQLKKNACFLKANGHAGAGEIGKDIVCAAVSTLICTLAQCILNADIDRMLASAPHLDIGNDGSGRAVIFCEPKKEFQKYVLIQFKTIETGLEMLQLKHPEAVMIKYIS